LVFQVLYVFCRAAVRAEAVGNPSFFVLQGRRVPVCRVKSGLYQPNLAAQSVRLARFGEEAAGIPPDETLAHGAPKLLEVFLRLAEEGFKYQALGALADPREDVALLLLFKP